MEKVELKGFLYLEGDEWILADKPNLKACCLNKEPHVKLLGDFSQYPQSTPVKVRGMLCESVLSDAKIIEESRAFPWYTIAIVGGVLLLYTLLKSSSSLKR